MSELFFFGNYDVKETVAPPEAPSVAPSVPPSVGPYESGTAYLFFTVGDAPRDPVNHNHFNGGGQITYLDANTNNYTTSTFYLNDNHGELAITCYENDISFSDVYIDAQLGGERGRLYVKNIECNGDIYNPTGTIIPTGTIVPKFTGHIANIYVTFNFR